MATYDEDGYEILPPEPPKVPARKADTSSSRVGLNHSMLNDQYAILLTYCRMQAELNALQDEVELKKLAMQNYWDDNVQWILPDDETTNRDNLFNSEGKRRLSPGSDCVHPT